MTLAILMTLIGYGHGSAGERGAAGLRGADGGCADHGFVRVLCACFVRVLCACT